MSIISITPRQLSLSLIASAVSALAHASDLNLYASPTGSPTDDCWSQYTACSLSTARTKARSLRNNLTGNLYVNLDPGTYRLSNTLAFDEGDSGINGYSVIYQATLPQHPTVLSGGIEVTGWTQHDTSKNIWKATLPAGTVHFRQLYVNGTRAIRARLPNVTNKALGAPYRIAVSPTESNPNFFVVNDHPETFISTAPPNKPEVVWLSHWFHKRAGIASFTTDSANTRINFKAPAGNILQAPQNNTAYYYENAYSLLDAPGEWFYDDGTTASGAQGPKVLYYIPRSGEDFSTSPPEVVVPQRETIVSFTGTSASTPVTKMALRNLQIQHSNWDRPTTNNYVLNQSGILHSDSGELTPGAIKIHNASHIAIEDNTIKFTGAHGILLSGTVSYYRIVNNSLSDLSAGGIYEVTGNSGLVPGSGTSDSSYGVISSNLIQSFGQQYSDGVGILATTPNNLSIEFNTIKEGLATGISLGWRWDNIDVGASDNQIFRNRIDRVGLLHDDSAGIYTLGKMTGTEIAENHVSNITPSSYAGSYPLVGIYLDKGSMYKTVSKNVIQNVQKAFKAVNIFDITVQDNTFTDNYFDKSLEAGDIDTTARNSFNNSNIVTSSFSSYPIASNTIAGAVAVQNQTLDMTASSPFASLDTHHAPLEAVNQNTDEYGWAPTPVTGAKYIWQLDLSKQERLHKVEIVAPFGANFPADDPNRKSFEIYAWRCTNTFFSCKDMKGINVSDLTLLKQVSSLSNQPAFPRYGTLSVPVKSTAPFRHIRIVKTVAEPFYLNEVRVYRRQP